MRRPHVWLLVVTFLALALWHQPLRRVTFRVARFPLTFVESILSTLVWIPRVPALIASKQALREQLSAQQLEVVRLREEVRALTGDRGALAARRGVWRAAASSGEGDVDPSQATGGIMASILIPPLIPTQHLITLDRGHRHGVMPEGVVVDAAGVVGRIVEAHATTSVAMLLTDPNSRIACRLERSRESGLLIGTGERLCQLIYLDLEADVEPGDRVVTAGLGGPFPKGIMLGTVVKVVRQHPKASTKAWVRPAVALTQLEDVLCLVAQATAQPK